MSRTGLSIIICGTVARKDLKAQCIQMQVGLMAQAGLMEQVDPMMQAGPIAQVGPMM